MHGIPGNVMGALIVFYVSDILQAPRWISIIILGYYFFALVSVPLTVKLSYRIGRHNALVLCMVLMALITPPFYFFERGRPGAVHGADLLPRAWSSRAWPCCCGQPPPMSPTTTTLQVGEARTGLFYSLVTMTDKLGFAIGVGTSYPLLEFLGYVPGAANTPGSPRWPAFRIRIPAHHRHADRRWR